MAVNKHFQILRGSTLYSDKATALSALTTQLGAMLQGEQAVVSYKHITGTTAEEYVARELYGVKGTSGYSVFENADEVREAIEAAKASASTTVAHGAGITVSGDVKQDGHTEYTVSSNLVMAYNAASGGVGATITLKSAVREGEKQVTYGTVQVSDIIGNGVLNSTNYDPATGILTLTFKTASGGTQSVQVDLKAMIDIDDVAISGTSQNYLGVALSSGASESGNSQAVFFAKIQDISGATDGKTGLADAKDVKTYVDNATTELAISANGDSYINAHVDENNNKHLIVSANTANLTTGKTGNSDTTLTGTSGKLVDGSDIALKVSSFVNTRISEEVAKLDATVSSDTSNVNVTVVEADGKLTSITVTEDYAEINKTPTSSKADAPKTDASIEVKTGDKGKLVKASDLADVAAYAADKVTEEQHRVDKKIADLGGEVESDDAVVAKVKVKTVGGQVNDVTVTTNSAGVSRKGDATGARVLSAATGTGAVVGSDIALIKDYVDDKTTDLSISGIGDDYISVSQTPNNNKSLTITADVQDVTGTKGTAGAYNAEGAQTTAPTHGTLVGVEKALMDSKQAIEKVKDYVDGEVAIEAARADAKVLSSITALDATVTQTGDNVVASRNNVDITIVEIDGKLVSVTAKVDCFDCGTF